jgi:hypothetical protein
MIDATEIVKEEMREMNGTEEMIGGLKKETAQILPRVIIIIRATQTTTKSCHQQIQIIRRV